MKIKFTLALVEESERRRDTKSCLLLRAIEKESHFIKVSNTVLNVHCVRERERGGYESHCC